MEKIAGLREEFLKKIQGGWTVVTHGNCSDGTASAMVATHFAETNGLPKPEIVYTQYGFKVDNYKLDGKVVLVTDFAFNTVEENEFINDKTDLLIILDHHETITEKGVDKLPYVHYDIDKSGCRLTYEFFHGITEPDDLPLIVKLVEDRDLWNWKFDKTREMYAFMKTHPPKYMIDNVVDLFKGMDGAILHAAMPKLTGVVEYQDNVVESRRRKKSNMPIMKMGGYTGVVSNETHLISEIGNALAVDNDFSCHYFIQKDKITFSLRSIGDKCHVGKLAMKIHGGGGHENAGGFSIPFSEFKYSKFFEEHIIDVEDYKHLMTEEELKIAFGEDDGR